jgi:hypothetical protein
LTPIFEVGNAQEWAWLLREANGMYATRHCRELRREPSKFISANSALSRYDVISLVVPGRQRGSGESMREDRLRERLDQTQGEFIVVVGRFGSGLGRVLARPV